MNHTATTAIWSFLVKLWENPRPKDASHSWFRVYALPFMSWPFCCCPDSLLLCLPIRDPSHSTGHLLGSLQLANSRVFLVSLSADVQGLNFKFSFLFVLGHKAGDFKGPPLWLYKRLVVAATAYKIHMLQKWTGIIGLCFLFFFLFGKGGNDLQPEYLSNDLLPLLKAWHWLCFTLSVSPTDTSS